MRQEFYHCATSTGKAFDLKYFGIFSLSAEAETGLEPLTLVLLGKCSTTVLPLLAQCVTLIFTVTQ